MAKIEFYNALVSLAVNNLSAACDVRLKARL